MSLQSTLKDLHNALEKNQIRYALIGGLALGFLGIPRATMDIDFLVHEKDKDRLTELLEKLNFNILQTTPEVTRFRGIFILDILWARRALSQQMISDALLLENLRVLRPEDMIGLKIQAYKNDSTRTLQDKADIQNIIRAFPNIDWPRIKTYADLFSEWEEICKLR